MFVTTAPLTRQLRKTCQHPYLSDPSLERLDLTDEEQHKRLTDASGKLLFLKQLLPELKRRGHRILLFSQVRHDTGEVCARPPCLTQSFAAS